MAHAFAAGLAQADNAELVAVASRKRDSAVAFAQSHSASIRPSTYTELVANPEVDLVYIASPHAMHWQDSLMCLEAGKAVLCEKPFTINERQARDIVTLARDRNVFLMEAMWTRFLPSFVKLRALLDDKVIGDVQMMIAGGAFIPDCDPDYYLLRPDLGGGVLLDAGVYLVSIASMVFGNPVDVKACGHVGDYGVDDQDGILLHYEAGQTALLYVSMKARSAPDITLLGDHGRIYVHAPLFAPTRLTVERSGCDSETLDLPFVGNGYHYQAVAAAQAMSRGDLECDVMRLDETLSIMHVMDQIRKEMGLRYPMDA